MTDESPASRLRRLRAEGAAAALTAAELLGREFADGVTAWPATAAAPPSLQPAASPAPAPAALGHPAAAHGGDDSDELGESERAELRRLEVTVGELAETNDRIMAQNIALLADLEVAQRAVRELRADKDALALQLQRALGGAGR